MVILRALFSTQRWVVVVPLYVGADVICGYSGLSECCFSYFVLARHY